MRIQGKISELPPRLVRPPEDHRAHYALPRNGDHQCPEGERWCHSGGYTS